MTSEADAALARDAAGGRPGREVAILLGIALERLKRQPRRYAAVRIPKRLRPWRVTARIPCTGGEASVTVDVRSDCEENARTVAASTVLAETLGRATARPQHAGPPHAE